MQSIGGTGVMKGICLLLPVLLLAACSAGITTHDGTRAAELTVDFFSSLKTDQGVQTAYDWTDDSYKKETSLARFKKLVASVRSKNSGADIRLLGYETFGSREMIIVYAISERDNKELHFKLSLIGTKLKDYYLLDFKTGTDDFGKDGIYRDYEKSIIISGV